MSPVKSVNTPAYARELARHLLDRTRTRPAVVVSTTGDEGTPPWVDPDVVATEVGGRADVYLIRSGPVTWALSRCLPEEAQVFGDAARVYSPDLAWVKNPRTSRLYLGKGHLSPEGVADGLIIDALGAAGYTSAGTPAGQGRPDLREEADGLAARLHDSENELARIKTALEKVKAEKVALKKQLRAASLAAEATKSDGVVFADPEDQLRHEVYMAWAALIPAGEKTARPLPDVWVVGPSFLASLDRLEGVTRAKVAEVIAQVLVGLDAQLASRDLHRLRDGVGGNAPIVEREPGVYCWRVALQVNTPSARRLHYWRDGDVVELSRVVVHDDMTP